MRFGDISYRDREKRKMIKVGSLFDGIGGWQLAAIHAGVTPVWSSEIDPYPAAVTAHNFPNTQQLGDITKIAGANITPVDIIAAGSPCQNLSQAGNRKGLQGAESSLFYHSIRIVREMRKVTNGKYPKYFVWENVPGAFTSNRGADFRAVLSEIAESSVPMPGNGKWANAGMALFSGRSIAWRTLDARHFGVPQRRRRIFLVADLNSSGGAGEILFDPASLPGDLETSSGEKQGAAAEPPNGSRGTGEGVNNSTVHNVGGERPLTVYAAQSYSTYKQTDTAAATLKAQGGANGGGSENYVAETYDISAAKTVRKLTPLECERLQGLPDGYTDIIYNGKPAPDAKRYKALGNGMAQPCADFVMQRVVNAINKNLTG